MSFAVFILSTGRCGTQWIAKVLADRYGDQLEVEHEPLEDRYRPRQALAEAAEKNPSLSPEVRVHADAIERRIAVRPYLECGHPCWSSIPFLARRFAGRVRIVHLVIDASSCTHLLFLVGPPCVSDTTCCAHSGKDIALAVGRGY